MGQMDCFTCDYAEIDQHGRFLDHCAGFGNCSYAPYGGETKPWPIDQMKHLMEAATVSMFVSPEECRAYRGGIAACIDILKQEQNCDLMR